MSAVAAFVELSSGAHNVTGVGAWEDWDISGIVPAGTEYVVVLIEQIVAATVNVGARKNGSGLGRLFSANERQLFTLITPVDSARILEIRDENGVPGANFYIVGYWS